MKELLSIVVLAVVTSIATPTMVAFAQAQYPPPVPTECFKVEGDVDGRFVPGRVDYGRNIIVSGSAGVAEANGRIELSVDGGRALATFRAHEDGSFAHTLALPAWIKPGHHRIDGEIDGCGESSVDLEVLGGSFVAVQAGGFARGTSGVLPRTGISILSYIVGAFVLLGVGAVLLIVRNRRSTRSPLHRRWINNDTSSTEAGVAFLDTSHFVPRTSGRRGA